MSSALMLIALIMAMCTACGGIKSLQSVRIDQNKHTTIKENGCAKAYRLAQKEQNKIDNARRKQSTENNKNLIDTNTLKKTSENWDTVAKKCPTRLSEAVTYSVQDNWQYLQESGQISDNNIIENEREAYYKLLEVMQNHENVRWTHNPLAQAAVAEDKLSFILQTLAAKKDKNMSLKYSDMAASNANALMHAAGDGADLRGKVYEIPQQALQSGIAKDIASGKDLPIAAIAYMDCAREELAAFNQVIVVEENNQKNDAKNNSETNYEHSTNQANNDFKDAVIKLITSRLLRAYELGYPTDAKLVLK